MAVKFAAYESMRQLHKNLNNGKSASPQVRRACCSSRQRRVPRTQHTFAHTRCHSESSALFCGRVRHTLLFVHTPFRVVVLFRGVV
jgi:hypothetical protein